MVWQSQGGIIIHDFSKSPASVRGSAISLTACKFFLWFLEYIRLKPYILVPQNTPMKNNWINTMELIGKHPDQYDLNWLDSTLIPNDFVSC